MGISKSDWVRLFPGMLKAEPYQIVLYDNGNGWNKDKGWVDVAEAWNETRRHDEEYIVHNSHGTDVDSYNYDGPIKPLADAGLSQQAQAFADAEAAGRGLLEGQFPDVSISRLLYCANTTLVFQAETKSLGQVAIKLTGMKNERRSDMEAILPVLSKLRMSSRLVPLYRYEWLEAEKGQVVLVQWMPLLHRAQPKAKPGTGLEVLGTDLREIPHIQKIGTDIAKALEALHSKGLVHLDVKLENLLFTKTNGVLTACLGDFSSVKPVARQYEGKTSFTSNHAAPELRAGMPYSYGVDVYAWGQMMLRLLKNLPASGMNLTAYVADKRGDVNSVRIGSEADGTEVGRLSITDAEMPLLPAIIRAVNRDPKLRHADGSALYADLEARLLHVTLEKLPQRLSHKQTGNSGGQETRHFRVLVGILLAILLLAALGNRDTSRNTSKETSPIAESTHGTYTLLAGDAAAGSVEVRLLEARLIRDMVGFLVTVEVTNRSETSMDMVSGQATITAGNETFAGKLVIVSLDDLEPGQTKQVSALFTFNEGQKEPAFEAGAKLKDPVMEFTVGHILS